MRNMIIIIFVIVSTINAINYTNVAFNSENEALNVCIKIADKINYENEISCFIIKRMNKFYITNIVFSNIKNEVKPGIIPINTITVFHTHVNNQDNISVGDEKYSFNNKINISMYNTNTKNFDYKKWYDCSNNFSEIIIK